MVEDVQRLFNKKFSGVLRFIKNIMEKWSKQILYVWVIFVVVFVLIVEVYNLIFKDLKLNIVVLVIVMENNEVFLNK